MAVQIKDDIPRLANRLAALDQEVKAWGQITRKKLFARLLSLGIEDKIKLARTQSRIRTRKNKKGKVSIQKEDFLTNSLATRVRKKGGELESIAFSFAKHGIFLERGVGRSRPKGSSGAARAAKPWIAPVLSPSIEELADILENEYADIAAANLRIIVPGVINTTVKRG